MLDALVSPAAEAVVRALFFAGILVALGTACAHWRLMAVVAAQASGPASDVKRRLTWLLRLAVLLLVAVAALRLVQQAAAFADSPGAWPSTVTLVLGSTMWGKGWLLHAGALGVIAVAGGGPGAGRALARTVAVLALAVSPSLAGHAVGAPRLTVLAVAFDTVHVLAAGAWLGTLVAVAFAFLPALRGATPSVLVALLARFSPLALGSAAALAGTGAFASWLHLETLPALWTTDYGRALLWKLAALAGVLAAGGFNWKIVTPRLVSGDRAAPLGRTVAVELTLAALLIAITAVLVATPLPAES